MTKNEIKFLNSLLYSKYRYRHKKFIIEGVRAFEELLQSKHHIDKIFITDVFLDKYPKSPMINSNFDYEVITEVDFKKIQQTTNSQGIIAVVPIKKYDNIRKANNQNILILDSISDPGNMGTLLRSSVWFGIKNIFLSTGCVDIYNPKVVRSAMGAHFYLSNLIQLDMLDIVSKIRDSGHILLAATLEGTSYKKVSVKSKKWALILGSEAHGIDKNILNQIDIKISIPQKGSLESLNVAVAGSILLDRLSIQ